MESYRDRKTWLIDVRNLAGWRMKVYGITFNDQPITEDMVDAAVAYAEQNIAWPENDNLSCGMLTIHAGEHAVWLLVDYWVGEIVRHFLFRAPLENPTKFADGPNDGSCACVWELEVTKHERDAWVRHVLANPRNPDVDGYLNDCLEIIASR